MTLAVPETAQPVQPEVIRLMKLIVKLGNEGLDSTEYKQQLACALLGVPVQNGKTPGTAQIAYSLLGLILRQVPMTTPEVFRKTRKARGGHSVQYVEVGYVKQCLNTVFGPFWDFTRVSTQYLTEEVHQTDGRLGIILVHARLTVNVPTPLGWQAIVKESTGEAEIQRFSSGVNKDRAVNVGDDEKAAESDALKRCASYFGIAADVYWNKDELIKYTELTS